MRRFGFMLRVCQFVAVLLVAISLAQRPLQAQASAPPSAVRDSVLGVVQGLFDAMAARDTAAHCGVDTFTLLRTQRGWRLADLAYTVERTGCAPSPLGPIK